MDVDGILAEAKDIVLSEMGNVAPGGLPLESMLVHRALWLTEYRRAELRTMQGRLVAYAARNRLADVFPGIEGRTPRQRFRNWLKLIRGSDGGQLLSESAISTLTGLGVDVVPFCDENGVPIDHLLVPDQWPKLVDAIPAIRRAIETDDVMAVAEILHDVETFTNRSAIRDKYQQHHDLLGYGTAISVGNGRVLVMLLTDQEDVSQIRSRLAGRIDWNTLPATAEVSGRIITANLEVKE